MKLILMTFIFLTFNAFSSSGDGIGNGGIGYQCSLSNKAYFATLTLDTAEYLDRLYEKNYFKNYEKADKAIINEILLAVSDSLGKNTLLDNSYTQVVKNIAKEILNFNSLSSLNLFNENELEKVSKAINEFLQHSYIYIHHEDKQAPGNITQDTGELSLPSREQRKTYGFDECKLVQIAVYGYVDIGYNNRELALRFHLESLKNMDDFNFKSLLWHEVIYQALNEKDSSRTRSLVAKIMKKMY